MTQLIDARDTKSVQKLFQDLKMLGNPARLTESAGLGGGSVLFAPASGELSV
ncbi:hypothetical protein [Leisingera sp. McT4-56]|uniref:hypothetical protein n=1 Tax=Leisingera sp. McT4-56 TaxID=2881255 RepID=UPI001CF8D1B9|nr:hypothetical protein [Leisingera sp. McT4-56]MCB4458029.1 hypothetical protein [Leisingera sp. McT4-56]